MVFRNRGAIIAAATMPFLLVTVYLMVTRELLHGSRVGADFVAVFLAAMLGLAFLAVMPWGSGRMKALVCMAYIPIVASALFGYMFLFICSIYGDCL